MIRREGWPEFKKKNTCAFKYSKWAGSKHGRVSVVAFQKKHWFDSRITKRYLLDPGQLIGLIWDSAPSHKDTASIAFLKQAEDDGAGG